MITFKTQSATATSLFAAIASVGLLGMSAPAAAQDSPWNGFYIGANAGVTWSDSQADATVRTIGNPPVVTPPIVVPPSDVTAINNTTHFNSKHHTGFTGGLEAGYNYVMDGGLMLGIETDINIYDITGNRTRTAQTSISTPSVPPTTYTYSVSQTVDTDFLWTLRPRIGYAMDQFLIFASGGLALTSTQYKASLDDSRTTANDVIVGESKTKTGYAIGGGAAYALTESLSLKGEYLFTDFGHSDFHATSTNGYLGYDVDVHLKSHMFRAGLDYRF